MANSSHKCELWLREKTKLKVMDKKVVPKPFKMTLRTRDKESKDTGKLLR
jgi:hypothetical protein